MSDDMKAQKTQPAILTGLGLIELIGLLITLFAVTDKLLGLGWGAELTTVFLGLGIMLAGVLLYFVCRAVFAFKHFGK